MGLSREERVRYDRQLLLPDWNADVQGRLKKSKVFVAGCGGVGSSVLFYLVASGVGNVTVCDFDKIELSNLNRQILHNTDFLGKHKTVSALSSLQKLNPEVNINAVNEVIGDSNVSSIVGQCDLIVDCLDNFTARFVLNRYSIASGIPFIFVGISEFSGCMSFLKPPHTPCLRCIFKEHLFEEKVPVLGAIAGILGSMQAVESIKYLTGRECSLFNKMMFFDGNELKSRFFKVYKDPKCKECA